MVQHVYTHSLCVCLCSHQSTRVLFGMNLRCVTFLLHVYIEQILHHWSFACILQFTFFLSMIWWSGCHTCGHWWHQPEPCEQSQDNKRNRTSIGRRKICFLPLFVFYIYVLFDAPFLGVAPLCSLYDYTLSFIFRCYLGQYAWWSMDSLVCLFFSNIVQMLKCWMCLFFSTHRSTDWLIRCCPFMLESCHDYIVCMCCRSWRLC